MKVQDTVISMSTTECTICLSELFPGTENELALSCGCQFCRHCLIRYVEERISNGMADIVCPSNICNASLTMEDLQKISDVSIFERYLILNTNKKIALDPTLTWCPSPDCNTVCDIHDVTAVGRDSKYKKYSNCAKCNHEFFPDEIENELMAWKIQELNPNTRMCPNCNALIERNGGCSYVLCRYCLTMIKVEKNQIVLSSSSVLFLYLMKIFLLVLGLFGFVDMIFIVQNDLAFIGFTVPLLILDVALFADLVYKLYYQNYARSFWNYMKGLHH